MNKIIKSLSVIAFVGAIALTITGAYFSDSDKSGPNTFTAGTLEIDIDDTNNEWSSGFALEDMKPCFTDYINFRINNRGNNPVDITKRIILIEDGVNGIFEENGINEPECEAYGGHWNGSVCDGGDVENSLENVINYDLSVEVYTCDDLIWSQTIYVDTETETQTLADVYGNDGSVYLGMIPEGGYMLVTQSYHMDKDTGNKYQSDRLGFTITIEGKQVTGTMVLENKDFSQGWKLIFNDGFNGTLDYTVKHPTFDFEFTGKAPVANHVYYLIAGENTGSDPYNWDPNIELGTATSLANGDITITGDKELNANMKDAKIWLVPTENWDGSKVTWSPWPGCVDNFLFETGLIWYVDTDL